MSEREFPSERELAVHAQLLRPNRHDKKHLEALGIGHRITRTIYHSFSYKELPQGTMHVRLTRRGNSRFAGDFIGWVTVGDYDWIWDLAEPGRKVDNYPNLHFEPYSGSRRLNMLALNERMITISNPANSVAVQTMTGSM